MFLLGAGASISSGVQSATECIWDWKKEIFLTNNLHGLDLSGNLESESGRETVQAWIDSEGFYPPIGDPEEYSFFAEKAYPTGASRRKYFENLCEGKSPSNQ